MRLPVEELVEHYKDNLFTAAFHVCRDPQDAEDVVQDTFLQYYSTNKQFESEQHIRAWLLRVAINKAKNVTLSFWRRNKTSLEEYMETLSFETPEDGRLFEAVMNLPAKYRMVIHLYYYEEYPVKEIGKLLRLGENTVKSHLRRGRLLLKEVLKEEWNDDESGKI